MNFSPECRRLVTAVALCLVAVQAVLVGAAMAEPVLPAGDLSLNVPRHARRGLTASLEIRYRNVSGATRAVLYLPPGMTVEQTIPAARVGRHGRLIWDDLAEPSGAIKIKVGVSKSVPVGTTLTVEAALRRSDGAVTRTHRDLEIR